MGVKKKNGKKLLVVVIVMAFIILVVFKVSIKLVQSRQVNNQAFGGRNQSMASTPMVKAVPIKPEPIRETLRLTGNVEAEEEISVQPRVSGRLVSLVVDEGQAVKKGQLLAELDDESIRLQLQQSEANIANIKANLKQAEINVKKNKAEKERYRELLINRYVSQYEYENAENTYLAAEANWEGINAQLESQQKNYELLKLQLTQTRLSSPIDGFVLQKLVTPGNNLTTGTTVVTVAALNQVKLTFSVDQKNAAKLIKGSEVSFSTDAFPDKIFQGKIKQLSPIYDPNTHTLNLTAVIPNPQRLLSPGMFGTAEIIIGGKSSALVLPQDAVINQDNQSGVFIVDNNQIAHFQPVKTGLTAEGKVEILSGLKEGDQVVVIGQNRLRSGQEVQLLGGGGGRRPGGNEKGNDKNRSSGNEDNRSSQNQRRAGANH